MESRRTVLTKDGSREGLGSTARSSLSSASRNHRQRPLAVAVGWDHLEDEEGRKVVIIPTNQNSWSSYSSRPGLSLASSDSFETGFYRMPASSRKYHEAHGSSESAMWSDATKFPRQDHLKRKQRLERIERQAVKIKSPDLTHRDASSVFLPQAAYYHEHLPE
jgi:hypothetical protein